MSEPIDSGSTVVDDVSTSPDTPTTEAQSEGASDEGLNPAWQPLLSELPDYFHPKARTHLKTWDDNYRKLETDYKTQTERYKPYEPYLETDPEVLQYALNVFEAINNDPKQVYDLLEKHIREQGLLPDSQAQAPEAEADLNDPKYTELEKRQLDLDQRQERIDSYIAEQDYNRQVGSFEGEIHSQVTALTEKYGNAVDVEDLLQRMYVQTTNGKPFNAEAAFQEQKATFQRLYARQAGNGRSSPQLIPTTGTPAPSGDVKPENMNEDQRKAYFKYLLDIANAGG